MRVLFVTNGHGEAAIAGRIARDVRARSAASTDHFALVGAGFGDAAFRDVGPQRAMPSGGLVAMGNVAAFSRDLRSGFLGLLGAQIQYLRRARYDCIVAVGDVYALLLAGLARGPVVYVGTAKSVYVAKYGPFERQLLKRARAIFVRDAATAADLQARGVPARAPGNVIVDLLDESDAAVSWTKPIRIALLPGSREAAYADGVLLAALARRIGALRADVEAVLSIAPGLATDRFAVALRADGWDVHAATGPVALVAAGPPPLRGWRGSMGALLATATVAIGQGGTANEAAAASGVPVIALESAAAGKIGWYRMRQAKLLGKALEIVPRDLDAAARAVTSLLDDPARRAAMGAIGRERMGGRGGAAAIAAAIAAVAAPA